MQLNEFLAGIDNRVAPISPGELADKVKRAERMFGIRLPDSYVHFLSEYGRPFFTKLFTYCDDIDRPQYQACLDWFSGFSDVDPDSVTALHLLPSHDLFRELTAMSDRFPAGCIPFAHSMMGNTMLIDVSEGGEIVYQFWNDESEYNSEDPRICYKFMTRLANSFDELIEKLVFDEE
jgi:hypothetical protein